MIGPQDPHGWRYVKRVCNFHVSDKPVEPADLIGLLEKAVEKLKQYEAPVRPVIYCSARAARILGVGQRIRARLAAKRRRGPRLRSLVRSPSRAKKHAAMIESLARSFGPALTSPARPWVPLCPQ